MSLPGGPILTSGMSAFVQLVGAQRTSHKPRAPVDPSMAIDTRTIAELEAVGFTHIDARCAGCGRIVQMPFRMLLERKQITTATTVAELRRRYRCQTCGVSQAVHFRPVATRGQYGSRRAPEVECTLWGGQVEDLRIG